MLPLSRVFADDNRSTTPGRRQSSPLHGTQRKTPMGPRPTNATLAAPSLLIFISSTRTLLAIHQARAFKQTYERCQLYHSLVTILAISLLLFIYLRPRFPACVRIGYCIYLRSVTVTSRVHVARLYKRCAPPFLSLPFTLRRQ